MIDETPVRGAPTQDVAGFGHLPVEPTPPQAPEAPKENK